MFNLLAFFNPMRFFRRSRSAPSPFLQKIRQLKIQVNELQNQHAKLKEEFNASKRYFDCILSDTTAKLRHYQTKSGNGAADRDDSNENRVTLPPRSTPRTTTRKLRRAVEGLGRTKKASHYDRPVTGQEQSVVGSGFSELQPTYTPRSTARRLRRPREGLLPTRSKFGCNWYSQVKCWGVANINCRWNGFNLKPFQSHSPFLSTAHCFQYLENK